MPTSPTTVYTYAKCSTCRDAVRWLQAHDVEFIERPIIDSPPSIAQLRSMLAFQNGNLRKLFNTSGIRYRELDLAAKLPSLKEDEALRLLAGDGRLVKRPFVLAASFGLVGFDETAWAAAFPPRR